MPQILFLLATLMRLGEAGDAIRTGMFKSVWVDPSVWNDPKDLMPTQGPLAQLSLSACSTACLLSNAPCQAFRINQDLPRPTCEGMALADLERQDKQSHFIKIHYHGQLIGPCTSTYVYSAYHATTTTDPIMVGQEEDCGKDLKVPEVDPDPAEIGQPSAAPFKGGIFVLGMKSTKHAKYWLPGDTEWTEAENSPKRHKHSMLVSLNGDTDILAVGSDHSADIVFPYISLYHGDSDTWTIDLANCPSATRYGVLIAKNDDEVYLFGGEQRYNLGADALPEVFKYVVSTNKWHLMADMPRGGAYPNCGKAAYHNKPTVICLGSSLHEVGNQLDLYIIAIDVWTTITLDGGPSRATYGSLIFAMSSRLYMIRGYLLEDDSPADSMEVLDLETWKWEEPPQQLSASDVYSRLLVPIMHD